MTLRPSEAAAEGGRVPLAELVEILRCPCCKEPHPLSVGAAGLSCAGCGRTYLVESGVPIMECEVREIRVVQLDHKSNQMDESVLEWLDSMPGWSLNLGAGSSRRRPARCIELEHSIFRNTSVVGDAHRLPFKDATFEAVVSFNTFEHLADPTAAASELLRVLKPGGRLRLQTAFLQPLHEAPAHFYNATEFGVRRWFSAFDVDDCFVPDGMNPAYSLGWLASAVLRHVGGELGVDSVRQVGATTLSFWENFWEHRFENDDPSHAVRSLERLSQAAQRTVAFGHELHAVAPERPEQPERPEPPSPGSGWSLNFGAGVTRRRPARCIELDYDIFRNTSVVGDAHCLPFRDGTFEAAVSYNTFEHLADPSLAAAELLRVLKPGGRLWIRSAFFQPLHNEPAHFYNATEFGMRRWFADFHIEDCFVPPEMAPGHTLGWLANQVLFHVRDTQGGDVARMASQLRLSQFARFWEVPSTRYGFLKVLFEQMPDRMSHFSAGFEIRARRPLQDRLVS